MGRRDRLEGQRRHGSPHVCSLRKEPGRVLTAFLCLPSAQVIAVGLWRPELQLLCWGFHQPAAVDHGGRQNQSLLQVSATLSGIYATLKDNLSTRLRKFQWTVRSGIIRLYSCLEVKTFWRSFISVLTIKYLYENLLYTTKEVVLVLWFQLDFLKWHVPKQGQERYFPRAIFSQFLPRHPTLALEDSSSLEIFADALGFWDSHLFPTLMSFSGLPLNIYLISMLVILLPKLRKVCILGLLRKQRHSCIWHPGSVWPYLVVGKGRQKGSGFWPA